MGRSAVKCEETNHVDAQYKLFIVFHLVVQGLLIQVISVDAAHYTINHSSF